MLDPVCGAVVTPGPGSPTTDCHGERVYFCSASCREKFVCHPEKNLTDYLYDLAIVGGGPAGLSAGIYASLGGLDTIFLSKSIGGQAWDSTAVVNYPGFELITGPELVDRFQRQLFENLHLAHSVCEVTALAKERDLFRLTTEEGKEYRSKAVILATGMTRRRLGVPGEAEFSGRGVQEFHALLAKRYAGARVAVVGGGNSACQAALGLAEAGAAVDLVVRSWRADLYLRQKVEASAISARIGRDPVRIEGGDRVSALVVRELASGAEEVLPVAAVFAEVGLVPNSDLARDLVRRNSRGEIEVDANCGAGVPGLYAAGDVTSNFGKRILIAAGEGAKASLAVAEFLRAGRG